MSKNNIFLLFLILSAALFLRIYKTNQIGFIHPDEITMIHCIKKTAEEAKNHGYFSQPFLRTLISPPDGAYAVYGKISHILFHVPFYPLFKDNLNYFLYLSVFWSLLTIVLVFIIGKTFFTQKIGLLAALLLTFSAFDVQYARSFLSHSDSGFWVLLAAFFYLKRFTRQESQRNGWRKNGAPTRSLGGWGNFCDRTRFDGSYLLLTGLCLGISATFHATTLYFIFPLIICEFLYFRLKAIINIFWLCIALSAPFLFFEVIGLVWAKKSFLYNFFLVSERHGEVPTSITWFYTFKQFWISNGIFFSLGILTSILVITFRSIKEKNKVTFFLILFPILFFSYWTFAPQSLNKYFRYLIPILPYVCLIMAIFFYEFKKIWQVTALAVTAIVISNLLIIYSQIKHSLEFYPAIVKTIEQEKITNLVITNPFFESYISTLYPQLASKLKITILDDAGDAEPGTPARSPGGLGKVPRQDPRRRDTLFLLIEGIELSEKPKHYHKAFQSPLFIHPPYLFQVAYESMDLDLVEKVKNKPWLQKIYLIKL